MTDPMTRPPEAEVKPIAELVKRLRGKPRSPAAAWDAFEGLVNLETVYREERDEAASALESQAERIAELAAKVDKQNQIASQEYGMRVAAQERIATLLHENERIASLESSLAAIGSDTVEGKRIEEYVAHAVGRDTARCALAALREAREARNGPLADLCARRIKELGFMP